ncbi:molybdopterin-guanine dinucleotide biosynthesis protein B [Vulgatibacter sp.]|uniref:molybdopterin-guanine dinucleotide biosynthesis protein B n=1 Tax=Vulgatibacter sp. TaxID=1971226 RepID=UPI00356AA640
MIRYDEALARIRTGIAPLEAVELPPLRALGCHLAAPLVAPVALPPCDDSAMDGFAIRAASCVGASREAPALLPIGDGAEPIATGDPLPAWADAVAPIEWVRIEGERIAVLRAVEPGANVRRRGEDVEPGDVVAPAGARVDAGIVLAAASLGLARIRVVRRVRVAVLPVGHHLAAGRPDATGPAVVAAVRAWGALARLLPPATGDVCAVAERIESALRSADLLITAGAASVGESDVVPATVERMGAELLFHGVSIKPGKPIGVARHEGRTLLLVPGSPTAALAGLEGIGRQVHACLAGDPVGVAPVATRLGAPLDRRKGKTGLLRGKVHAAGGGLVFTAAKKQGPAQIAAVAGTNALAVIPPDVEAIDAGNDLPVLLLDRPEVRAEAARVVAVCGYSGAGKTWVVEQLVARLTARGLRVATVKHDGCGGATEESDSDTAKHRAAGAFATTLVDDAGTVVRSGPLPLARIAADHLARGADLVIAEGFKTDRAVPKIEVAARGRERVHAAPLLAYATDGEPEMSAPSFAPDAAGMDALAQLILERTGF